MRPPGCTAGKMDEALVHEPSAWAEAGTLSLLNELGMTALGLPVQGN